MARAAGWARAATAAAATVGRRWRRRSLWNCAWDSRRRRRWGRHCRRGGVATVVDHRVVCHAPVAGGAVHAHSQRADKGTVRAPVAVVGAVHLAAVEPPAADHVVGVRRTRVAWCRTPPISSRAAAARAAAAARQLAVPATAPVREAAAAARQRTGAGAKHRCTERPKRRLQSTAGRCRGCRSTCAACRRIQKQLILLSLFAGSELAVYTFEALTSGVEVHNGPGGAGGGGGGGNGEGGGGGGEATYGGGGGTSAHRTADASSA
eukprot:scaffold100898_cov63-Phaeocystis_antarctica.AAC.4